MVASSCFSQALERIVRESFSSEPPPVLYHYTTWDGLKGILQSGKIWATAHDCTNDSDELFSADDAILRVATALLEDADPDTTALLQMFLTRYADINQRTVASNYLACFCAARDKDTQWKHYGAEGAGVCIAVPLLDEPLPDDELARVLIRVRYSSSEVEAILRCSFLQVCRVTQDALADGAPRTNEDTALPALSAVWRVAAFGALAAKTPRWQDEEEWRVVAVADPSRTLPLSRTREDGRTIRYIELPLRQAGRPIAVSEVIVGPAQDSSAALARAQALLEAHGYATTGDGATLVTASTVGAQASA